MAKPDKGNPHDRIAALEDAVDKLVADRLRTELVGNDDRKGGDR